MVKGKIKLIWSLALLIIFISVVDWILPQGPLASISEGIMESLTIALTLLLLALAGGKK